MIKDYYQHLGLKFVRQESGGNGPELKFECPFCGGKDSLAINTLNGKWHCWKNCEQGNARTMAQKLTPLDRQGINELLKQFGLGTDVTSSARTQTQSQASKKKKPKDISWFKKKLREPEESELERLCNAKGIKLDILKRFNPMALKNDDIICLPVHNPSDMKNGACGYIRVHMDGKLIFLKSSGKEEKYPTIGTVGLIGVEWIAVQKDVKSVLFCEGWRDALAAMELGYIATASSAGASTWEPDWLPLFKDRQAVVIQDEDAAGVGGWITQKNGKKQWKEGAAIRAAKSIMNVATETKITRLPFPWQEKHGKDLYDYIKKDN